MISNGVDGRDTFPVYASCKLHSREATVKEPPDPTPIMLGEMLMALRAAYVQQPVRANKSKNSAAAKVREEGSTVSKRVPAAA